MDPVRWDTRRPCYYCGETISECMGFTKVGDLMDPTPGVLPRELCWWCSELGGWTKMGYRRTGFWRRLGRWLVAKDRRVVLSPFRTYSITPPKRREG